MKYSLLNWKNIENYLKNDDRCVFPIGSTEQHAYLSLSTDSILAEKISLDAAQPLNIPVLPVLHYGHTPLFMSFPGTISLRIETLWNVVNDVLDSLIQHRFLRILIVNGHGGNVQIENFINEWKLNHPDIRVKFHSWWNAPKTWAKVNEIDPQASHASWMENFEWTRLEGITQPVHQKPMVNRELIKKLSPEEIRKLLDDGSYGGFYQRSDKDMKQIWEAAVEETRELLLKNWD